MDLAQPSILQQLEIPTGVEDINIYELVTPCFRVDGNPDLLTVAQIFQLRAQDALELNEAKESNEVLFIQGQWIVCVSFAETVNGNEETEIKYFTYSLKTGQNLKIGSAPSSKNGTILVTLPSAQAEQVQILFREGKIVVQNLSSDSSTFYFVTTRGPSISAATFSPFQVEEVEA